MPEAIVLVRSPGFARLGAYEQLTQQQYFTELSLWVRNSESELRALEPKKRSKVRSLRRQYHLDNAQIDFLLGSPKIGEAPTEEAANRAARLRYCHILKGLPSLEYLEDVRDGKKPYGLDALLRGARKTGDKKFFKALWKLIRQIRPKASLVLLVKSLEREAYLDYLRQWVTPRAECDQIPRPIHVRARPPTSPLAPPV